MNSVQSRYCEEKGCDEGAFHKRVFWECLHRRALILVPFFGGWKSDYFAADRALIAEVARATRMSQVAEDIAAFGLEPDNTRWLRRIARVRISGRRVQRLARRYLPSAAGSSSPYGDTLRNPGGG